MAIRRQHPDDPSFARLAVIAVGLEFGLPDLTLAQDRTCLLYTSPSPRDRTRSRMPSSA